MYKTYRSSLVRFPFVLVCFVSASMTRFTRLESRQWHASDDSPQKLHLYGQSINVWPWIPHIIQVFCLASDMTFSKSLRYIRPIMLRRWFQLKSFYEDAEYILPCTIPPPVGNWKARTIDEFTDNCQVSVDMITQPVWLHWPKDNTMSGNWTSRHAIWREASSLYEKNRKDEPKVHFGSSQECMGCTVCWSFCPCGHGQTSWIHLLRWECNRAGKHFRA